MKLLAGMPNWSEKLLPGFITNTQSKTKVLDAVMRYNHYNLRAEAVAWSKVTNEGVLKHTYLSSQCSTRPLLGLIIL